MKKFFTLLMLVSMSVIAFAQAPKVEDRVATLEGQVKTLQGEMTAAQSEINQLKDRYAQYQKQLNLKQTTKLTVDSIEYGVLNAVGNKATGYVTITLCAVNKGSKDGVIQLAGAELTDFDGNVYSIINDINIGNPKAGCSAPIRTDIPIKIYITFKKVAVGARIANLHTQEIAHHKGFSTNAYIDFRDINIEWK